MSGYCPRSRRGARPSSIRNIFARKGCPAVVYRHCKQRRQSQYGDDSYTAYKNDEGETAVEHSVT